MKITNRPSITGRANQRSGAALESIVELSARGTRLHIYALPKCGAKFVGKGRIVKQKVICDFAGGIAGSPQSCGYAGRAFFCDAKTSEHVRGFTLDNRDHVPDHQFDFLKDMSECGAVAGLLVRSVSQHEYFWLAGAYFQRTIMRWDNPCWVRLGIIDSPINFSALL